MWFRNRFRYRLRISIPRDILSVKGYFTGFLLLNWGLGAGKSNFFTQILEITTLEAHYGNEGQQQAIENTPCQQSRRDRLCRGEGCIDTAYGKAL